MATKNENVKKTYKLQNFEDTQRNSIRCKTAITRHSTSKKQRDRDAKNTKLPQKHRTASKKQNPETQKETN